MTRHTIASAAVTRRRQRTSSTQQPTTYEATVLLAVRIIAAVQDFLHPTEQLAKPAPTESLYPALEVLGYLYHSREHGDRVVVMHIPRVSCLVPPGGAACHFGKHAAKEVRL